MKRHGRLLALLAVLAVLVTPCLAKLAAFDVGGNFLKVAVVQPGRKPISIAENEMSRRQTPVLVGFVGGQRVLGEDAVTASARHPDKFVEHLRDLIGRRADDPRVARLLQDNFRQYDLVADQDRGAVKVNMPGETEPFSIEELMASELAYAHQSAVINTGIPKLSVVLLVPPHYGPSQRQALLDAAEIARLDVLSLVQSHAAAALQYGIERDFAGRTEQQVLLDIGSTDAVAALVEYSAYNVTSSPKPLSQLSVQDMAWSVDAGTGQLDTALMRHFAAEFEQKTGAQSILSNGKTAAKLRRAVRRTKEMLTANTEAPLNVEELHDGQDFAGTITRDKLEELMGGYWDHVKAPLLELVERNNLGAGDANISVQLLGGGSRVPAARAALQAAHPAVQLEKQLDASEAFAMGAGLYAANKSTTFRLRKFGVLDASPFAVSVSLYADDKLPEALQKYAPETGGKEVYPTMAKLDWRRRATFPELTADPFHLTLAYTGPQVPCCLPEGGKLATYTVTGLSDILQKHNDTEEVTAKFHLDANGMVSIASVEVLRVFNETEMVSKQVPDEEAGAEAAAEVNSTAADADDSEAGADTASDADAATNSSDNSTAANSTAPAKPKMKTVQVPKTVLRKVSLPLKLDKQHHGIPPMPTAQKKASASRLAEFAAKEAAKREVERARNELESYIVNTRSRLDDDEIVAVTTEEQRDTFRAQLTDAEDWLYMDPEAESGTAETFKNKLATLTAAGDPIKERAYEAARRPEREQGAKLLVDLVKKAGKDWPSAKPWLNATHVERLLTLGEEFETWLTDVTAKQKEKAGHEEPAYTIAQLQDRFEVVSGMFTMLKDQKAPPKKAAKASDNAESKDDADAAGANDAAQADTAGDDATADADAEDGAEHDKHAEQTTDDHAAESEGDNDAPVHDEL